ncbi:hypothetical protein WAI453_013609 [Rhynchosporium graminicola]
MIVCVVVVLKDLTLTNNEFAEGVEKGLEDLFVRQEDRGSELEMDDDIEMEICVRVQAAGGAWCVEQRCLHREALSVSLLRPWTTSRVEERV